MRDTCGLLIARRASRALLDAQLAIGGLGSWERRDCLHVLAAHRPSMRALSSPKGGHVAKGAFSEQVRMLHLRWACGYWTAPRVEHRLPTLAPRCCPRRVACSTRPRSCGWRSAMRDHPTGARVGPATVATSARPDHLYTRCLRGGCDGHRSPRPRRSHVNPQEDQARIPSRRTRLGPIRGPVRQG
jgi:hypothetical protein